MNLCGTIKDGLGEGAWYVRKYSGHLKSLFGYNPFPGTLNIRIDPGLFRDFSKKRQYKKIDSFEKEGTVFGEVMCFEANLSYKGETIPVVVLLVERTAHPSDIIEIIARISIREHFSIKEGDSVCLS